jgi:hypothetical protein
MPHRTPLAAHLAGESSEYFDIGEVILNINKNIVDEYSRDDNYGDLYCR